MRLQHQAILSEKDSQIRQMQNMLDKCKYNPKIDEFIKEIDNLNSLLMQQKEIFFQKIEQINPYYGTSDKLKKQIIDMRFEYEEIHKTFLNLSPGKNRRIEERMTYQ